MQWQAELSVPHHVEGSFLVSRLPHRSFCEGARASSLSPRDEPCPNSQEFHLILPPRGEAKREFAVSFPYEADSSSSAATPR